MYRHVVLAVLLALCAGCASQRDTVRRGPWPGDATPFGVAKGRRQISTWGGGWEAIGPHADIISSVSVFGLNREFVDKCHGADIEVYLAIGGDVSAFDTPERADASIQQLLKRCDELGIDGVDLDFERFGAELREEYTAYIVAMADALHQRGLKLSICVDSMMPGDPVAWLRYDPEVIGRVCDQVRVMCYCYMWAKGGQLGPTCTRPWAKDAMLAWMKFVPREKLVMGLPAFSHDVAVANHSGKEAGAGRPQVDAGAIIKQGRMPHDAVSYYVYRDANGDLRIFYASDAYSTHALLLTADQLDIPAVSFWHAGKLTPEMWQTVREWMTKDPELQIDAGPGIFTDTITVSMENCLDEGRIRYTLDGREPSPDSKPYRRPFVLSESATIKARVFSGDRAVGFTTASRKVAKVEMNAAVDPGNVVPGLHFEYYEGEWQKLPDFDSLRPAATGIADTFDIGHRKRDDRFGFRFTGYVKVPQDGAYSFFATSDDGIRLRIGDQVVVENDGLHPPREAWGPIALSGGLHPITVEYFDLTLDEYLRVAFEGPGIEKQTIPAEALFHQKRPKP